MNMDSVYLRRLYKTSCMAFRMENRFVKKGGVVFVGDSITDFCNLDMYYPGLNAVNRGISGDTIEGILGRMKESVFDLAPSLVVILGGVNNFQEGYEDVETAIVDTYRTILTQIKTRLPDTKVLVQSLYPVSDVSFHNRYQYGHGHIRSINTKLQALVRSLEYEYADVYSVLEAGNEEYDEKYSDDGLHPNKNGYKVISECLRPIIDDLLGRSRDLVAQVAASDTETEKKEEKQTIVIHGKEIMTSFIERILVSVLALAMGILFCVGVSAAVSITLGVILCVYGVINIIIIGIGKRPLFSVMGVINGVILAIGIAFCAHDLSTIVVLLMPFVLTILGALMLIDGFVCYFSLKQGGKTRVAVFSVAGSAMYSLGLSLLCVEDFRLGYCELVFGIMLCVASVILLLFTIVGMKKKRS